MNETTTTTTPLADLEAAFVEYFGEADRGAFPRFFNEVPGALGMSDDEILEATRNAGGRTVIRVMALTEVATDARRFHRERLATSSGDASIDHQARIRDLDTTIAAYRQVILQFSQEWAS